MVKGNSTFVVSIRLPDSVKEILQSKAKDKSISEYLKQRIISSCDPKLVENDYVNKSVNIVKPPDLQVPQIDNQSIIPRYNPLIHKKDDVVLKFDGKNWVRTIVPDMDMDGNKIWE